MVFVKKDRTADKAHNVGITMGFLGTNRMKDGEVGLEIEIEGKKLPIPQGMQGSHQPVPIPGNEEWSYVDDGSLRGFENGGMDAEYVLTNPVMFSAVPAALDSLWAMFRKKGAELDESNRTSIHVHLNVQKFHLNRLASIIGLYFALEDVLAEFCGDHRVGNLFCLRGSDAPAVVSQARSFIRSNMESRLREGDHYAALNTYAIAKFGSLEFRLMRGVTDPKAIVEWVSILRRLYDVSADFTDPRDICGVFSSQGPNAFFDQILGDKASVVRSGISMTENELRESMYTGIRLAQDICYARDWDVFKPVEYKPDPFKRDPRKTLKRGGPDAQIVAAMDAYVNVGAPIPANWAPVDAQEMPMPDWDEDD